MHEAHTQIDADMERPMLPNTLGDKPITFLRPVARKQTTPRNVVVWVLEA